MSFIFLLHVQFPDSKVELRRLFSVKVLGFLPRGKVHTTNTALLLICFDLIVELLSGSNYL